MAALLRIIVADDHPIIHAPIASVLSEFPTLQVVGIATSFRGLFALLETTRADAVILDVSGMQGSVIATVERLRRLYPWLAVMVFSSVTDLAPELFAAGVHAYIAKDDASACLLQTFSAIQHGQTYASPVVQAYLDRSRHPPSGIILSPKEL